MDLRLIVVTDAALAAPRAVPDVVAAALRGGAPAIQLRAKQATTRDLFDEARALRRLTRAHGALLFIDDRLDVALAVGADGVHLGPDDLPLEAARNAAPAPFRIGYSTDDPAAARRAEELGADYIGCGAVFGTASKAEAAGEAIGVGRVDEVAHAVRIPVVAIGGVTADNADQVGRTAAAGVAVLSAIMRAADPEAETRRVLERLGRPAPAQMPRPMIR